MPADLLFDLPEESQPSDVNEYVEQFNERLRESHKLVQKQMHTTFARMKRNYDAKVKDPITLWDSTCYSFIRGGIKDGIQSWHGQILGHSRSCAV